MTYYDSTDQLIRHLKSLFDRLRIEEPEATRAVTSSRLIIRLNLRSPQAEILINGRYDPAQVSFQPATLRPDLDIYLPADILHQILLAELSLKKALASGQMTVRGPIYKTFALEDIFRKAQAHYPQVLRELAQNGRPPDASV